MTIDINIKKIERYNTRRLLAFFLRICFSFGILSSIDTTRFFSISFASFLLKYETIYSFFSYINVLYIKVMRLAHTSLVYQSFNDKYISVILQFNKIFEYRLLLSKMLTEQSVSVNDNHPYLKNVNVIPVTGIN